MGSHLVKRRLIDNAMQIVWRASNRNGQKRDLWGRGQREAQRECEIDTVTKLAPFGWLVRCWVLFGNKMVYPASLDFLTGYGLRFQPNR
jgi:hypothetical protein